MINIEARKGRFHFLLGISLGFWLGFCSAFLLMTLSFMK
jgi:hypothetical protein